MNLQVVREVQQELCQEGGGVGHREGIVEYMVCVCGGCSLAENKGEPLQPLEFRQVTPRGRASTPRELWL